jgi:hypothetical protein
MTNALSALEQTASIERDGEALDNATESIRTLT